MNQVKHRVLNFVGVLGIIGIALIGLSAFLIPSVKAAESFNPANIISDSIFTNRNAMTISQIQNFLESKGSACLAHFSTLSLNDSDGDGLGDEPYGKGSNEQVSAATVIWQASQIYGINPQVILATLQKEQGLVTRTDCPDWRYNTALGYGCPDSAPCDNSAYGFTRQIDYGVWHFRGFFDDTYPVPPTIPGNKFIAYNPDVDRCSGSTVNIYNRATAALYSYTPYQPNAATLAAAPGQLVDCGAYGNLNFWRYFTQWFGSTQYDETFLSYKSHTSYVGWTDPVVNRGMTGFVGQSKPMEAFKINGEVEYSSYSFSKGWQPTVNAGMMSGTTEQNKTIQAITVNPTGTLAQRFDIYYRAHVSYIGWMGWAKNGVPAGVTGDNAKNIEAFEIQLIPKGSSAPGSSSNSYQNIATATNNAPLTLGITSHVGSVGWQPSVTDGMITGTTEQSKRIEAIKVSMNNNTGVAGSIAYSTHVSGIGWQDVKSHNQIAGTTGQFRQIEALRIALNGPLADNYDIWYRGYVQFMGWQGWAKNGAPAGSIGASRQLEALEIRLSPKGTATLAQNNNLYNPQNRPLPDSYSLAYSTHIGYVGWSNGVSQNTISGTTGQSKNIEALRIDNSASLLGDVSLICSAYVKGSGWVNNITPGSTCGTTGQSKSLEAIKFSLSGTAANKYDVYYKIHVSWLGWQEWAKNAEVAGVPDSNRSLEAVIVKLVEK